jgi:hypothetical protein
MAHKNKNKALPLQLGPLPVQTINRTLETELDPGEAVLTAGVQTHASRRHPEEYARCLPHVAAVVTNPLYIGDDFKNPGSIELISRVPALGSGLLVAVCVEKNGDGEYEVRSFYPVNDQKIRGRLSKGFLKIAQKR